MSATLIPAELLPANFTQEIVEFSSGPRHFIRCTDCRRQWGGDDSDRIVFKHGPSCDFKQTYPVRPAAAEVERLTERKGGTVVVSPRKLESGAWGVHSALALTVGQVVTVRTAAGREWSATVAAVAGNGLYAVSTEKAPMAGFAAAARNGNAAQAGCTTDDLVLMTRAGVVSVSNAMNQDM